MTLFPFFEPVDDRTFLLVGGGRVATGKLEKLLPFTKQILIIAEDTTEVEAWCLQHEVALGTDPDGAVWPVLLKRPFADDDLDRANYVIGATDDRPLNRHISERCRERKIPVNIVDDAELCTFIFPSLVKRGDLVAGITAGGKTPGFGQYVRKTLEEALPDNTETLIDDLYAYKLQLKETVPEHTERARLLRERLAELLKETD